MKELIVSGEGCTMACYPQEGSIGYRFEDVQFHDAKCTGPAKWVSV